MIALPLQMVFFLPFSISCSFFFFWRLDIIFWVIRTVVIRFFSVRCYVDLVRRWAIFNASSICKCYRLQCPFTPSLLSLGLLRAFSQIGFVFCRFSVIMHCYYTRSRWMMVKCWRREVFYNPVIKSQYFNEFESLGHDFINVSFFFFFSCERGRLKRARVV